MKKQAFSTLYTFFSSLFIITLLASFGFAKRNQLPVPVTIKTETVDNSIEAHPKGIKNEIFTLYDSLHLDLMGLPEQTFEYAVKGYNYLVEKGKLADEKIISIVDLSQPSSRKRLFVVDLNIYKVLFCTYVAHGVNSGAAIANRFSNKPESNKSSLGFYETKNTYIGGNGYSLKLEGLEKGINDNAGRRDIVMHGASYVNEGLIRVQGFIGRSWGCPAVPEKLHKPIIDKIKNGTCLFIYSHDKTYLKRSKILKAVA